MGGIKFFCWNFKMVGKGFIASASRSVQVNQKSSWFHIDASDQVVGRLASQIAKLLIGKHKPIYDPSVDCGDNVVITNAKEVTFTRNNWNRKLYRWHTGYPGGLKQMPAWRMRELHPERILGKAVWGMLPKNKLRRARFARLKIFNGPEHTFQDQLKSEAELPPHFKHQRNTLELLPADDELAHLRGFYAVKLDQTDTALQATGVYIRTLREQRKRDKQIARSIRYRPPMLKDYPSFAEKLPPATERKAFGFIDADREGEQQLEMDRERYEKLKKSDPELAQALLDDAPILPKE